MESRLPVPEPILRLLEQSIDSVDKLEALALIREGTSEAWTAPLLADRLHMPPMLAEEVLVELERAGLLTASGDGRSLRYGPRDQALDATVAELFEFYRTQRLAVLHELARNAVERMRRSAARTFADSFRLKPPPGKPSSDA